MSPGELGSEHDPDTTGATEVRFVRKAGEQEFVPGHIAGVWDGRVHVTGGRVAGGVPGTESDYSEPLDGLVRVDLVFDDLAQGRASDPGGWTMTWGDDDAEIELVAGDGPVPPASYMNKEHRPAGAPIEIRQVDERDSSWEDDHPRFRVYLHGSGEDTTYGWTDTYDITGADVLQVIDWAERQAGTALTYAVALVSDDVAHDRLNPGHGRGLTWLVGMDGNDTTEPDSSDEMTQRRMLGRRHHRIHVGEGDTMPTTVLEPYENGEPTSNGPRTR